MGGGLMPLLSLVRFKLGGSCWIQYIQVGLRPSSKGERLIILVEVIKPPIHVLIQELTPYCGQIVTQC